MTTPKAATFTCPAPGGCTVGASYTFIVQASTSAPGDVFAEVSFAIGPASGPKYGTTLSLVGMLQGWHLIALPPGSKLSGTTGQLFTLQPEGQTYEALQPGQDTVSVQGYWVYTPAMAVAALSNTRPNAGPISTDRPIGDQIASHVVVPAGGWALVGNPTGASGVSAGIGGADAAYIYDPSQGYQPLEPSLLRPGQAAIVYAAEGGDVSVTPIVP